jgi:hypothetical protein
MLPAAGAPGVPVLEPGELQPRMDELRKRTDSEAIILGLVRFNELTSLEFYVVKLIS